MKGQSNGLLWGGYLGVKALNPNTVFNHWHFTHLPKPYKKKKHSKCILTLLLKHGCTMHVLASNMQRKGFAFHQRRLPTNEMCSNFALPVTFHSFPALTAASWIDSQSSCKALGGKKKKRQRSLLNELHSSEKYRRMYWNRPCLTWNTLETRNNVPYESSNYCAEFKPSQWNGTIAQHLLVDCHYHLNKTKRKKLPSAEEKVKL